MVIAIGLTTVSQPPDALGEGLRRTVAFYRQHYTQYVHAQAAQAPERV